MPNGKTINSTHTTLMPITGLPLKAREAHIFPGLKNWALLSIGTFCDNECIAIFNDKHMIIKNKLTQEVLMKGGRDPNTTMYMLELHNNSIMTENSIPDTLFGGNVYAYKAKLDLVLYFHRTCRIPTKKT